MPGEKGSAFLLKVGNGGEPTVFATVAGMRTTQMSINGEAVNVTSKDSGAWRELLSGAGVRSVSVGASGIFTGSAAETRIKGHALSGMVDDYKATGLWMHRDGTAWREGELPVARILVAGQQAVGPRQAAVPSPSSGTLIDQESRAAIDQIIATLISHGLID